ncbi:MAG TPA: RagB/SusD family nutrient uptake outer membrane protein, partial [Bacteroidales bacterium]|nr:RagB/SusD family nutrient uptake outer membrane protein [Bacteroidales bacterium]
MKKLIYAVFIITGIVACEMIELPESKVSREPIFNSDNGLKLYTNSFYETFPDAPALYTNSYYIAVNSVIKYFTENGFSAEESSGWNWGTLRNINYFIVNNNDESVPLDVRNNYQGIARFFRAYFYFGMMQR